VRPKTGVFGAVLAGTALVLGTGVASADPPRTTAVPAIAWTPCQDDATADCGTLRLPIDWARPNGEQFDLAVARRKATDPARREGILVINPGGPGGSGVDFALYGKDYFSPDVEARFDIIGFDPRGVARSQPVKCSLDKLAAAPSNYPADQAGLDAIGKYNKELRDDCRAQSGPIVDHASTGSVIQDVDALRRSLGEKKINYYGISYGTLIGQQYAERYGDKIRAMVIDSNMDHSLGTRDFMATSAATAEDSFNEFVKWCDRTESCALHGQDVVKVWEDLLARADRGEIHYPGDPTVPLTSDAIISFAFRTFYGPDWTPLADQLAELVAQKPATTVAAAAQVVNYPFPAVFCEDFGLPVRNYREYASLYASELRLAPHMRGGPQGHSVVMNCLGWTDRPDNPQHRLDIDNAPTVLMLNAVHDPATSYAWATNAHKQSRHDTVLLTYEGWGHGAYDRSACTRGAVDNYLTSLTVPHDGTRCAAVEPPETASLSESAKTPVPGPRPGIPGYR
jgi:pimeloyl-ACP methyl ester carboxylesterase